MNKIQKQEITEKQAHKHTYRSTLLLIQTLLHTCISKRIDYSYISANKHHTITWPF